MSNRYYYKNAYSLEVDVVNLFGSFIIGASGAVSAVKGGGIASIVKNVAAGNYTITFQDKYSHFFNIDLKTAGPSISPVAVAQLLATPATMQADIKATKSVTVQLVDFAGAAVDATPGDLISINAKFRVSSIGRND